MWLYQLPPFTTIHSILCVQFTCLTVLSDNLSPGLLIAANFRRTDSPSRLAWSEGWRPPGAQSTFTRWTGWTLTMTLVMMTAPKTLSWLLLLLLLLQLPTDQTSGARFTKYLATILRLSYDNAKVTIDLQQTSKLQNILWRTQDFSRMQFTCKIVRSSEIVFLN